MAEEQSSLRTAIDKIMGWPAGGAPAVPAAGTIPSAGFTQPRSAVANLGTTSALENVIPEAVPDPFEAQLADIRAQNNALSASLAAPATAAPAAPAAAAPSTWSSDLLALQKQYAAMPRVLTTFDQSRQASDIQNAIAQMSVNRPEGVTPPSLQEQMAMLYPSRK